MKNFLHKNNWTRKSLQQFVGRYDWEGKNKSKLELNVFLCEMHLTKIAL